MTADATTIRHRYPWSLEERGSIAVLVVGPAVLAALFGWWRDWPSMAVGTSVAGLLAAAALFRLGSRRKNRSAISARLTGTRLEVTGGRVKSSKGDIAGARVVVVERMGPETVLVLGGSASGPLRVPMRIAVHPDLARVLRRELLHDGVAVSAEARDLLEPL